MAAAASAGPLRPVTIRDDRRCGALSATGCNAESSLRSLLL